MAWDIPKRLLLAVGGNAIHPADIRGTSEEQVAIAAETGRALLPLLALDNQLLITHGNGPVVGKLLMRQALARHRVEPVSLDICVADTQGGIAYVLMQGLENALRQASNPRRVACLLTQVEVNPDDPAFHNPSKPVGYFFDEGEAKALSAELGWRMREDAGRGWRHIVPSPSPQRILNLPLIDYVMRSGAVVIAGGGGGVPVVRAPDGTYHGVEAVVDKDLTSAELATQMGIEVLMILTAVSGVCIHFDTPEQRELGRVKLSELLRYHQEGHFPPGSMGPKVESAIRFLEGGGKRAIIAHLEQALPALRGEAGTQIVRDWDE